MPEAIELKNVTIRYGGLPAVKGCTLEVHAGETLGILGPNGAGKTTVLKAVTGEKIFAGEILLFGKDIRGNPAFVHKSLGVAPQEFAFFNDFTVEENIGLIGRLYGLGGKALEERTAVLLENFTLKRCRKKKASELSGGFKRILNMAVSFIHGPPIVLLDEPTVGLDTDVRKAVWGVIRGLKQAGTTIVLTTHYLEEAEKFCDRIAIIFDGRILAVGSPAELVKKHGGDALISATLLAPAEGLLAKLKAVDGVKSASSDASGICVRCRSEASTDVALKVMRALDAAGAAFQDFSIKLPSLDDAFTNIVGAELGVQ